MRLCKHRKKVFHCFYKITSSRKKKNSLFRLLNKEKFLPVEVLYTKLNVHVISSCFAIKILSKKRFYSLKMSALAKKKIGTACL